MKQAKWEVNEPWFKDGPITKDNKYQFVATKKSTGEKYIKSKKFKYNTYPNLKKFWETIGFKHETKRKRALMPFFTTASFFENVYGAYQSLSFSDPNKWDMDNDGFGDFKAVTPKQVKKLLKGTDKATPYLPLTKRCGKASYPPKKLSESEIKKLNGGGRYKKVTRRKNKKVTRRKNKKVKRKQTRRKK